MSNKTNRSRGQKPSGLKQTSYMLPEDLLEALRAKSSEENISTAEIVRRALKYVLGLSNDKSATENTQITELEKKVADHTKHFVAYDEKLLAINQRLEQIETVSNNITKQTKSLKPTQPSTKPHSAIYGSGEAASIYPGWEVPANISYVFNQFQVLNTDEARAAFADKWIGLCAQSLDTAWVVCYRLLSIIKEKEMYKIPHWMEGNKTYSSFKDYFEHRFKQPFEKWLKLEQTNQFVVEHYPELLEALLNISHNTYPAQKSSSVHVLPSTPEAAKVLKKPSSKTPTKLRSTAKSKIKKDANLPHNVNSLSNPRDSSQLEPLSVQALSKRLGVHSNTFYRRRNKMSESDLEQWIRSRDPDGIGWVYSNKSKKFHPSEFSVQ